MSQSYPIRRLSLLALVAALPLLPAQASDFNYLEGGFVNRDNYGRSGGGGRTAGSVDLQVPIAPFAEFSSADDLDQLSVGAVFHAPVNRNVSWFAGGSLEHADNGFGSDTGFGLRGGLQWQATRRLELTPEVRYVDLYNDGQVAARLTAAYEVAPRLALVGAVQGGDDDRFEAGVRYRFGRAF